MSFDLGKLFIEWRRIVPNGVPNQCLSPRIIKRDLFEQRYDRQVDNAILLRKSRGWYCNKV